MKYFIPLALIGSCIALSGCDLEKFVPKEKIVEFKNEQGRLGERYHAIRTDTGWVKDGFYEEHDKGVLKSKGTYSKGLKDSSWLYFEDRDTIRREVYAKGQIIESYSGKSIGISLMPGYVEIKTQVPDATQRWGTGEEFDTKNRGIKNLRAFISADDGLLVFIFDYDISRVPREWYWTLIFDGSGDSGKIVPAGNTNSVYVQLFDKNGYYVWEFYGNNVNYFPKKEFYRHLVYRREWEAQMGIKYGAAADTLFPTQNFLRFHIPVRFASTIAHVKFSLYRF